MSRLRGPRRDQQKPPGRRRHTVHPIAGHYGSLVPALLIHHVQQRQTTHITPNILTEQIVLTLH